MAESQTAATRRSRLLLAALVPSFYCIEWLLVAVSASLFAWLKYRGLGVEQIWLLFWAGNLAVSAAFLACNDRLQVDFTLMQALRRGTEMATGRCPGSGRGWRRRSAFDCCSGRDRSRCWSISASGCRPDPGNCRCW